MSGSQPTAGGELHPRHPDCTAPPADTRRVTSIPPHTFQCATSSRYCACTFYLVFKEPTCPRSPSAFFSPGEPFNLTNRARDCQPNFWFRRFFLPPHSTHPPSVADA